MNLFAKKFFGTFKGTAQLEREMHRMEQVYERYMSIEKSELLQEYKALRKEVKSSAFKDNKKILINRKFKDTEEYQDWHKYNHLKNSPKLNHYFTILQSPELAAFLAFKQTDEYELIGNKIELKKSEKLRQFRAYEKSRDYKLYIRFHGSYLLEEYERLKQVVSTPEFIEFKEFWSDPHRWLKTEDYQKDVKFRELSEHADIIFYQKTDSQQFDFFRKWKKVFEDDFNGPGLDKSKWEVGYYFADQQLIRHYSLTSCKQANNEGKNVTVADSCLTIETLKESVVSRAWDDQKGFVMHKFDYTSDVINAGNAFQMTSGLVQMKLRIRGGKITHVCCLVNERKTPQINLFHVDHKMISVGYVLDDIAQSEQIKGISPYDFYIFSVEWSRGELIWRVNNQEVFRVERSFSPSVPLFPLFASIVRPDQEGVGHLDVDWIRIYQSQKPE
ncbi:glycoside hydrolase family 16 protein [Microbacter margulisiae]|uniref:GH16 domain-containing protein n=1 Tax=Microbacter margulisiae TaxID=1350067 RepID=A0A7W5H368_9PORP|nr:hypothetical protein [Microbacter margulisiae]MBB3188181.1 hypothetical protein [Microbacter margulisiae]